MKATNLTVTGTTASYVTISYALPSILLDPNSTGFNKYEVYLLKKVYAAGALQTNAALDALPVTGTTFINNDTLSCRNDAAGDDPNCTWSISPLSAFTRQAGATPFGALNLQPVLNVAPSVPVGGSIKYRLLIAIDGAYQVMNGDASAVGVTDTIEITMLKGTFTGKRTLKGNHGKILGQNTHLPFLNIDSGDWVNSKGKWLLDEATGQYLEFFDRIWFFGGTVNDYYRVYGLGDGIRQPDLTYHVNPFPAFTPRTASYTYATYADLDGFLKKTTVGDGQLDLKWKLQFDGADLFVPKNEAIDNSLQPEQTDLTKLNGPTNTTQTDPFGVTSTYDIFTQHGVFSKIVAASIPGGPCHSLQQSISEYDSAISQYNTPPTTLTFQICPTATGDWDVSDGSYYDFATKTFKRRIVGTLRKNNTSSVVTLRPRQDVGTAYSTMSGLINSYIEIRIK